MTAMMPGGPAATATGSSKTKPCTPVQLREGDVLVGINLAIAASAIVAAPGGEEAVSADADMISDAAEARQMLRALTIAGAQAVLLIWRPAVSPSLSNSAQALSVHASVQQAHDESHEQQHVIDDPSLFDLADSIHDLSFPSAESAPLPPPAPQAPQEIKATQETQAPQALQAAESETSISGSEQGDAMALTQEPVEAEAPTSTSDRPHTPPPRTPPPHSVQASSEKNEHVEAHQKDSDGVRVEEKQDNVHAEMAQESAPSEGSVTMSPLNALPAGVRILCQCSAVLF